MKKTVELGFLEYFKDLEDPRVNRGKLHVVDEILLLTLAGIMCGCESWEDIEEFGIIKKEFFKTLLPFKNGIPSDDTLRRFFTVIDYKQFQSCFICWIKSMNIDVTAGVIAIDGKTSRGSRNGANKALHMISAFASDSKIVLGQEKIHKKSNEVTAIPKLLELLDIKGATVTIDALGCQTKIATKIREKEADYLLAVKKNQEGLFERIERFFNTGLANKDTTLDIYKSKEINRGRKEIRKCYVSSASFLGELCPKWPDLKCWIKIESTRIIAGEKQYEERYYISSKIGSAKKILNKIRSHWSIENSLHWVLDVGFNEDASKIRKDNAPANMAIVRHVALNLMRQCKPKRRSLKGYKKNLGWSNEQLLQALDYMSAHANSVI
jgi:predicted transposase YbfD/YdcC